MGKAFLVATTITPSSAIAAADARLGGFDDLQTDQLDLGAAILQHLLSRGQHLILHKDITSTESSSYFITMCLSLQVSWDWEHIRKQHTERIQLWIHKLQKMRKSTVTAVHVQLISLQGKTCAKEESLK